MSFKKGNKLGKGRPPGATNKSTAEIREAFQQIVSDNIDNVAGWILSVSRKDPEKATKLLIDVAKFIIPIAKQEIDVTSGGDQIQIVFKKGEASRD